MSDGESTKHLMDTITNTADAYLTEGDGTEAKSTDWAILNSYKNVRT